MRCLAILLLLCAAAAVATAHDCPSGMRRAWSADRKALNRVGLEAFQHHIAESCAKMPVFVTEPSFFKADVRAVCTTADRRTAQFRVTYASPCAEGKTTTVFMTVQTRPTNCKRDYDPKLAKWGWWTKSSGNMRPLECPTGFRYATRKDEPLLRAFVQKEFLTKSMPDLKRRGDSFYCKAGIERMDWSYDNGCIQTWPKGVAPYVMAQAKVKYVCYNSHTTRKLGIDGEGTFKRVCEWKVDFAA